MKHLHTIIPILALILVSCNPDPYADAVFTPKDPWVGEDVKFTNLSTNTDYVEWTMGDGVTYSAFSPTHYYIDPGKYTVNLRAFGKKSGVSVATFVVDVYGSELKVIVQEVDEEYAIEEASVILYASEDDWFEADIDKAVGGEQFTNRYGECWFEGLSYQMYYVDVYYRVGNEGYVNWLLGEYDIGWVETQELPGGYDHTFFANVEAVTFDDSQAKSTGRPALRPPMREVKRASGNAISGISLKENKTSTKLERK